MSSSQPKSAASPVSTIHSFLEGWSEWKIPAYIEEYGGERAGVSKGENIPFPPHKVKAAVALLAYGAPKRETLTGIARSVPVSCPLLRVWRSEERFLALYRRAVWECADAYMSCSGGNPLDSPIVQHTSYVGEVSRFFGVALKEALFRRLCVDVHHMALEWTPIGLTPKWLSECTLVGPPPKTPPSFLKDIKEEGALFQANSLLAGILVRRLIKDPMMAQWAIEMLLGSWGNRVFVNTYLRDWAKKDGNKEALRIINAITHKTPLDDIVELYQFVNPAKKGRRGG